MSPTTDWNWSTEARKEIRNLQDTLNQRFGVPGGLQEQVTALEAQLPKSLVQRIRWLGEAASDRQLPDKTKIAFFAIADKVDTQLQTAELAARADAEDAAPSEPFSARFLKGAKTAAVAVALVPAAGAVGHTIGGRFDEAASFFFLAIGTYGILKGCAHLIVAVAAGWRQ